MSSTVNEKRIGQLLALYARSDYLHRQLAAHTLNLDDSTLKFTKGVLKLSDEGNLEKLDVAENILQDKPTGMPLVDLILTRRPLTECETEPLFCILGISDQWSCSIHRRYSVHCVAAWSKLTNARQEEVALAFLEAIPKK